MSAPVFLNRKLVLEEAQLLDDGHGGFNRSWIALGTLWANVVAGSGRESETQTLTVSSVPYRITVRNAPEGSDRRPKPDQRFREGSRVYRIAAVSDADRSGHYLLCHVREEVLA